MTRYSYPAQLVVLAALSIAICVLAAVYAFHEPSCAGIDAPWSCARVVLR